MSLPALFSMGAGFQLWFKKSAYSRSGTRKAALKVYARSSIALPRNSGICIQLMC